METAPSFRGVTTDPMFLAQDFETPATRLDWSALPRRPEQRQAPRLAYGPSDALTQLAPLLIEAMAHLGRDPERARVKLSEAMILVGAKAEPLKQSGGLAPWQVKRLEAYITGNLAGQLRSDEAASLARVSPSHFSRSFKKTFRQSFSRYVMTLRLERACALLTNTDQPISQVAVECGLNDQSHLTRLFHRQYGAPPHAWRRAHGRHFSRERAGGA